ncbi:hypothetical protein GK047_02455 [Paenibacillus sp. SYP-B3998]|uniref:Uncharacterized protein n=1 Tax=Paenibacillus sp. SYP-B3998 TaxID=2678564 RepID=A0A6G3ZS48_9BACL|nr:hypothetical protein [Paenibacillus sp. SYP-B3998]NEW04880.1 hypothetical protein [Paenibacillus sp. SYP-B3998]
MDGALIGGKSINMTPNSIQYYNETDETIFIGTSSDKLKFLNPKYKAGNSSWTKPFSFSFSNEGNSKQDRL